MSRNKTMSDSKLDIAEEKSSELNTQQEKPSKRKTLKEKKIKIHSVSEWAEQGNNFKWPSHTCDSILKGERVVDRKNMWRNKDPQISKFDESYNKTQPRELWRKLYQDTL